jgi:hypothetical protein
MASIMTMPNGSGQSNGKQEGSRVAQESALRALVDLSDELDARLVQQRCNLAPEVGLVDTVHLGRDLERQADGAGDCNRPVDALLRRYGPAPRSRSTAKTC